MFFILHIKKIITKSSSINLYWLCLNVTQIEIKFQQFYIYKVFLISIRHNLLVIYCIILTTIIYSCFKDKIYNLFLAKFLSVKSQINDSIFSQSVFNLFFIIIILFLKIYFLIIILIIFTVSYHSDDSWM